MLESQQYRRVLTVKTLIRAIFAALSIDSIGIAQAQPSYHALAHNYYQNNWGG